MTDGPNESQNSTPAHPRRVGSFRAVAERITGRATNLFASGLVLIMGMLLGREMISVWKSTSHSKIPGGTSAQLFQARSPAIRSRNWMAFGDHPGTLMRTEIRGDIAVAMDQLRRDCRLVADQTWHTPGSPTKAMHPWLKMLCLNPPAARDPEKWVLHEMQQPLPMIAALEDRNASENARENQPADTERGIVCWGLAIPADAQPVSKATAWNSFVFSPAKAKKLSRNRMEFELPAGCEQLVAIQDEGSLLAGFSSNLEPTEVAARWDNCQAKAGWRAVGDWQVTGSAWHRRYEHSAGKSIDIQFAMQPHARILGFCLVTSIRV